MSDRFNLTANYLTTNCIPINLHVSSLLWWKCGGNLRQGRKPISSIRDKWWNHAVLDARLFEILPKYDISNFSKKIIYAPTFFNHRSELRKLRNYCKNFDELRHILRQTILVEVFALSANFRELTFVVSFYGHIWCTYIFFPRLWKTWRFALKFQTTERPKQCHCILQPRADDVGCWFHGRVNVIMIFTNCNSFGLGVIFL